MSRQSFSSSALTFGGCLLALAACTGAADAPVAPVPDEPTVSALATLICTGSAEGVSCEPARSSAASARRTAGGPSLDVVLGGQNTYVRLVSSNNAFNATTLRLTGQVTITNLTDQPLGTADGTTLDPEGVRVFFHTAPTNGVTVVSPDGVGIFTGSNQPYYQYNQIIPANGSTFPVNTRTWTFQLPSASTTFTFSVFVTGAQPNESAPVTIPPHTFTSLSQGATGYHMCAIRSGGASYCWGEGRQGQTGEGINPTNRATATGVIGAARYASLVRGAHHTCGLTSAGAAYCWGYNAQLQLGDGSTAINRFVPGPVQMPAGVTFTSLAAGDYFTCGLAAAGAAYCWGDNSAGQLGGGIQPARGVPTPVQMPAGVSFSALTGGSEHACGLTSAGAAYCWGIANSGQIGDGQPSGPATRMVPTAVQMPAGVTFTSLAAFASHTCALSSTGRAYCWGSNFAGAVGDGTQTRRDVPTAVQMPAGVTFTSITAGNGHACAVSSTGTGYCWGANTSGAIGDGTSGNQRLVPTLVQLPAGVSLASMAGGMYATCGLSTTGLGYCWGAFSVGDGTGTTRVLPTAVLMP